MILYDGITLYHGSYIEVTKAAIEIAIGLLQPERLKNQVCFRNERALQNLEFVKTERVLI